MNCLEFRQQKLSDPEASTPEQTEHRETCPRCQRFERDLLQLDADVRDAFAVPVPEDLEARILLKQSFDDSLDRPHNVTVTPSRSRWQWLGLAASVATVAILFGIANQPKPETTLAQRLTAHLGIEEMLASMRSEPVSDAAIRQALAQSGINTAISLENVMHAKACTVNGRLVAHLVVRDGENDLSLLLTPFAVDGETSFSEGGYDGILEPTDFGSIAVLTPSPGEPRHLHRLFDRLGSGIRDIGD